MYSLKQYLGYRAQGHYTSWGNMYKRINNFFFESQAKEECISLANINRGIKYIVIDNHTGKVIMEMCL